MKKMPSGIWRTNSDLRWTFVSADSVSEGLVQLARILDDFDLEPYVSHLHLQVEEDAITIGALTEMTKDEANRRTWEDPRCAS